MFNPLNLITKFIKSSNQKELDRIGKIVEKINSHEEDFKNFNDDDFPKKTNEFRNQLKDGKTFADINSEEPKICFLHGWGGSSSDFSLITNNFERFFYKCR